jgi:hypothetical protein
MHNKSFFYQNSDYSSFTQIYNDTERGQRDEKCETCIAKDSIHFSSKPLEDYHAHRSHQ